MKDVTCSLTLPEISSEVGIHVKTAFVTTPFQAQFQKVKDPFKKVYVRNARELFELGL